MPPAACGGEIGDFMEKDKISEVIAELEKQRQRSMKEIEAQLEAPNIDLVKTPRTPIKAWRFHWANLYRHIAMFASSGDLKMKLTIIGTNEDGYEVSRTIDI